MGTAPDQPPADAGADQAAGGTAAPPAPTGAPAEPSSLGPSDAEVDAWAERERQRREGWSSGPTADERAAWTQRERERRLERFTAAGGAEAAGLGYRAQRGMREAQLAAAGAWHLFWKGVAAEGPVGYPVGLLRTWARRGMDVLIQAGREWEAEQDGPRRGRRVPLPDDGEAP